MDIAQPETDKRLLRQQQDEIDEYRVYQRLARVAGSEHNRRQLRKIADQELGHYEFWRNITGVELGARRWKVWLYVALARSLGLAFALKRLERGEARAQRFYEEISDVYPQARKIARQEEAHEMRLIDELDDRKLAYAGAIVLGMNDALVELTGTLAGVSFAFQNTLLIGVTGLIMGIAASLSMAGSGYLESREDHSSPAPALFSAAYTGGSYILTTAVLVLPYFVIGNPFVALVTMLVIALLVIGLYSYYIAVAKSQSWVRRAGEMAAISLGVAAISFGVGYVLRHFFGIHAI